MKKIVLLFLICTLFTSGCGKTTAESTEATPINLSIWHYYGGTADQTFSYLVQNFNQTVGQEKGIVVSAFSYDGVSALSQAIQSSANGAPGSNPMPSIFAAYSDSVVPLESQGLIANLDEYFTTDELETYYAPFIEEGRFSQDGHLSTLPIAKSTEILHINKTYFDDFALQCGYTYDDLKTWEGIAQVSEAYYEWTDAKTEKKRDGKAFFGTDGMANFMIIGTKQLGVDIFSKENDTITFHLTEDIAQKMWDVFYIPFIKGYFAADAWYRSDDLTNGTIVSYVGSTASSYYFPDQVVSDDNEYLDIACKTLPYPSFVDGDAVAVQQGASMVISKSTPEEEAAAAEFLKWFTQPENNAGFAVSTGYMPVKNQVLDVDFILAEMQRDGFVDDTLPIVQATYTSYEQLNNYDLYTSLPFEGSADVRTILENSLPNKITADKAILVERVMSGENIDDVTLDLIGDENFQSWYLDFCQQIEHAFNA